jgi:hypothetical protein
VSLIDLSGSADGSWASRTEAGSCRAATVTVLVDAPERWRAEVAALGSGYGRFEPISYTEVGHREGRAIKLRVPVVAGWSVLRLTARDAAG